MLSLTMRTICRIGVGRDRYAGARLNFCFGEATNRSQIASAETATRGKGLCKRTTNTGLVREAELESLGVLQKRTR